MHQAFARFAFDSNVDISGQSVCRVTVQNKINSGVLQGHGDFYKCRKIIHKRIIDTPTNSDSTLNSISI